MIDDDVKYDEINPENLKEVTESSGLPREVCAFLLTNGWVYSEVTGQPNRWTQGTLQEVKNLEPNHNWDPRP